MSEQLASASRVFGRKDPMLAKQAYPPVYYLFVKIMGREYAHRSLYSGMKAFISSFHALRQTNLSLPEDQRDPVLIEFGRLMQQGTNDKSSLQQRVTTRRRCFLQMHPDVRRLGSTAWLRIQPTKAV